MAADDCEQLTTFTAQQLRDFEFESESAASSQAALEEAQPYRVASLRIVGQTIFNPGKPAEDKLLFRLADRLHLDSKPAVIRAALPFRKGDEVSTATLREAERILREKVYLYDARVIATRRCGRALDLLVIVRDVWTLNPRLSFLRSGGENEFSFGLSDQNVLGFGKAASVAYSEDEDRTGVSLIYADPNVAGSRVALGLIVEDNDDGDRQAVALEQPFFSLQAPRAWAVGINNLNEEGGLHFLGDEIAEFQRERRDVNLHYGVSRRSARGFVQRVLLGFSFEEQQFAPVLGEPAPDPLPEDRRLAYPWLEIAGIQDDFVTSYNVDRIQRTEDLFVGHQYRLRLGYSDAIFGADDQSRIIVAADFVGAQRVDTRHLLRYGLEFEGFYNIDDQRSENLQLSGFMNYLYRQSSQFSLLAQLQAAYTRNLFVDEQLLLGGSDGLRGFPNRYQLGDRRFLVTLEQRYFSNIHLFKLLRLGGALFVDAGRAWFPGTTNGDPFGVLSNIGMGLRIESTRTRRDRILHVDVAFPLNDGPDVNSAEVTLTVKTSF